MLVLVKCCTNEISSAHRLQKIRGNIAPNSSVKSACVCVSRVHSFILAISIAPLQVHYYSEAFLTTARNEISSANRLKKIRGNIAPNSSVKSACVCVSRVHSFIHSFILDISIAPLQVHYYSEAFLTTARILYRSFASKRTGNC